MSIRNVRNIFFSALVILSSVGIQIFTGNDIKTSQICAFFGLWDFALDFALKAKETELDVLNNLKANEIDHGDFESSSLRKDEAEYNYLSLSKKVARMFYQVDEIEEAIKVYEYDIMPRTTYNNNLQANHDFFLGAFTDLAYFYKKKGNYDRGLKWLQDARELHLARKSSSKLELISTNSMDKNKLNLGYYWLWEYETSLNIDEAIIIMDQLKSLAKRKESYIKLLEEKSRKWNFSNRISNAREKQCATPVRLQRKNRFFRPSGEMCTIVLVIMLIFLSLFSKYVFKRTPTYTRRLGLSMILAIFSGIVLYFSYKFSTNNFDAYISRLVSDGTFEYMIGRFDRALSSYDEARCAILENPYQETLIKTDCGIDSFYGALSVYIAIGTEIMFSEAFAMDDHHTSVVEKLAADGHVKKAEKMTRGRNNVIIDELAEDIHSLVQLIGDNTMGGVARLFYMSLSLHHTIHGEMDKLDKYSEWIDEAMGPMKSSYDLEKEQVPVNITYRAIIPNKKIVPIKGHESDIKLRPEHFFQNFHNVTTSE